MSMFYREERYCELHVSHPGFGPTRGAIGPKNSILKARVEPSACKALIQQKGGARAGQRYLQEREAAHPYHEVLRTGNDRPCRRLHKTRTKSLGQSRGHLGKCAEMTIAEVVVWR